MLGHGVHGFPSPAGVEHAFSIHHRRRDQIDYRRHLAGARRRGDRYQLMLHRGPDRLGLAIAQAVHIENHGPVQMLRWCLIFNSTGIGALYAAKGGTGNMRLGLGAANFVQIAQQGRDRRRHCRGCQDRTIAPLHAAQGTGRHNLVQILGIKTSFIQIEAVYDRRQFFQERRGGGGQLMRQSLNLQRFDTQIPQQGTIHFQITIGVRTQRAVFNPGSH